MSWDLKYEEPSRINQTIIHKQYLNNPTPANYERCWSVITKLGVVVVSELQWVNNFGVDVFTCFETSKDGFIYRASIGEAVLSDRRAKYLATRFIKTLNKQP